MSPETNQKSWIRFLLSEETFLWIYMIAFPVALILSILFVMFYICEVCMVPSLPNMELSP